MYSTGWLSANGYHNHKSSSLWYYHSKMLHFSSFQSANILLKTNKCIIITTNIYVCLLFYMQGTGSSDLNVFKLLTTFWRRYYYSHFTNEETEA